MLTRECALVPHKARIISVLTWRQEDLLAVHSGDLHAMTQPCQHWHRSGCKHAKCSGACHAVAARLIADEPKVWRGGHMHASGDTQIGALAHASPRSLGAEALIFLPLLKQRASACHPRAVSQAWCTCNMVTGVCTPSATCLQLCAPARHSYLSSANRRHCQVQTDDRSASTSMPETLPHLLRLLRILLLQLLLVCCELIPLQADVSTLSLRLHNTRAVSAQWPCKQARLPVELDGGSGAVERRLRFLTAERKLRSTQHALQALQERVHQPATVSFWLRCNAPGRRSRLAGRAPASQCCSAQARHSGVFVPLQLCYLLSSSALTSSTRPLHRLDICSHSRRSSAHRVCLRTVAILQALSLSTLLDKRQPEERGAQNRCAQVVATAWLLGSSSVLQHALHFI